MAKSTEPRVVAELGRPETPDETFARKAENSRKHRANQTLFNLVIATVASLGIVLFLVLVVVRPTDTEPVTADYQTIAADAQSGASEPLLAPTLPAGWYANSARLGTTSSVQTWYVGFVTPPSPSPQFIALEQGIDANETWLSIVIDGAPATGLKTIDEVGWVIYDRRSSTDAGNYAYSMSAQIAGSTVVLHGTATDDEFELLAAAIAAEAKAQ
ncbi:exodeoxyribonuclease VII small subunit [marine actinobacterium PHSC20C1]|nr:exodeoxyribonuclease VII small subunit [marine actinobacterium PHSC20C1]